MYVHVRISSQIKQIKQKEEQKINNKNNEKDITYISSDFVRSGNACAGGQGADDHRREAGDVVGVQVHL